MGQRSSQPASTQAAERSSGLAVSQRIESSRSFNSQASSQETLSRRVTSSSAALLPLRATNLSALQKNKHSLPQAVTADTQASPTAYPAPKRRKLESEIINNIQQSTIQLVKSKPKPKPSRPRSQPQHRRGLAIKPIIAPQSQQAEEPTPATLGTSRSESYQSGEDTDSAPSRSAFAEAKPSPVVVIDEVRSPVKMNNSNIEGHADARLVPQKSLLQQEQTATKAIILQPARTAEGIASPAAPGVPRRNRKRAAPVQQGDEDLTVAASVDDVETIAQNVSPIGRPEPPKERRNTRKASNATSQAPEGAVVGAVASAGQTYSVADGPIPLPPAVITNRLLTPPTSAEQPSQGPDSTELRRRHEESKSRTDIARPGSNDIRGQERAANEDEAYASDYDPRLQASKDADSDSRVASWLHHPQSPQAPDDLEPSQGSPVLPKSKPIRNEKPGKFKSTEFVYDSDEYGDAIANKTEKSKVESKSDRKKATSTTPATVDKPQIHTDNVRGTLTGAWTDEEKATADIILASFTDGSKDEIRTLRNSVAICWGENVPQPVKDAFYDAFPSRAKKSIRRFLQRHFHTSTTGPWTAEEDAIVREKHKQFHKTEPHLWAAIASLIEREPSAIRDRWRHVLSLESTMKTGVWTSEEEADLMQFVAKRAMDVEEELARMGADERTAEEANAEMEKCIDWTLIEKDMKGTRSAKRCREKWVVLKRRNAHQQSSFAIDPKTEQRQQRLANPDSRQLHRAAGAYAKLSWQDVFDAMTEIYIVMSASSKLDTTFQHESSFWSTVSIQLVKYDFPPGRSQFKKKPKLRRKCFYDVLERFGDDAIRATGAMGRQAEMLREKLLAANGSNGVNFKADGIKALAAETIRLPGRPSTERKTEAHCEATEHIDASHGVDLGQPKTKKDARAQAPDEDMVDDAIAGAEAELVDSDEEMVLVDEYPISSVNSRLDYDDDSEEQDAKRLADKFVRE